MRPSTLVIVPILLLILPVLVSNVSAAGVAVSAPQTISQGSQASYTVTVSPAGPAGQSYQMSVSGVAGYFSPNPVGPCGLLTCPPTTLVVDATTTPTYCPGTYSFTVTATSTSTVDTGTGTGSVTVLQVGPPLQVSVFTDKTTYRTGETVTVSITVTRAAEGQVMVTGPSGSPMTYPFSTSSAGSGVVATFTAGATGSYTVSAQADDYCSGFSSAQATFSVSPNTYDVTISLTGIPSQYSATLQVDGQSQGSISATKTVSFPIGSTHTISVDQYVSGTTGVRYYCAQNTWSVSSANSYTFNYETQYQLSVSTDPSGVTAVSGGGWFDVGASAQTSQAPQTVPGSTGVQYVFKNWMVDGAPQNGNQISIAMNGPHTAVATYATQYMLTVNSPGGLGNPQGAGYYDAGSTAQFSVTSPVGYLVQQVFVQWQGDYTGTSPQGSITMTSPKSVTAVWATSYTNVYIVGGAIAAVIVVGAVLFMRSRSGSGPGRKAPPEETKEKKRGLHMGDSDSEP